MSIPTPTTVLGLGQMGRALAAALIEAGHSTTVWNRSPGEARELAGWAAGHGIDYLDGGVMAVPEMIGGPGSAVFYSGSATVFEELRSTR